jgi:hypothetical protein
MEKQEKEEKVAFFGRDYSSDLYVVRRGVVIAFVVTWLFMLAIVAVVVAHILGFLPGTEPFL